LNLENDSSVDKQTDQFSDSALEEEKALSNVVNLPLNQ